MSKPPHDYVVRRQLLGRTLPCDLHNASALGCRTTALPHYRTTVMQNNPASEAFEVLYARLGHAPSDVALHW